MIYDAELEVEKNTNDPNIYRVTTRAVVDKDNAVALTKALNAVLVSFGASEDEYDTKVEQDLADTVSRDIVNAIAPTKPE